MTVTGSNLEVGDIIGSGTISGDREDQVGSILERSWNGQREIVLGDGISRKWLLDGDTVTIRARAGQGVGFGECFGTIEPALNDHEYY